MDMDLLNQLERPVPVIKVESEKIVIEASEDVRGRLLVTNSGGGTLEGRVMSKNPCIHFLKSDFEGNSVRLEYETRISGFKPGDLVKTNAVIMSNGGEKTVEIIIKIITTVVETKDGQKITGIKDFLNYTKRNPQDAGSIFLSRSFRNWLSDIGYEYMDIFDFIAQDSNVERAIENFFVLSKQKNRPSISLVEKNFSHEINPLDINSITGVFHVKKNGWGYVECPVTPVNPAAWLSVKPGVVSSELFGGGDTAEINYYIDPKRIKSKIEKAVIKIAGYGELEIQVRTKPLFECRLRKESCLFEDTGYLHIINNSGSDVLFEIAASESFIKFEGKKYLVGKRAEIPFKVKLTGIQSAQLAIKRQPFAVAEIHVRTDFNKSKYMKSLRVRIGDL